MKISVLIGTRNRSAPLVRCLASVATQRLAAHETVVLDDASDQLDVAALVRDSGHGRVRVVRSDRRLGVGAGRNRLFREATGDVFFSLDDDAFLDGEHCLGRIAEILRQRPRTGIVATRIVDHRFPTPRLLVPFPRRTRQYSPEELDRGQLVSYFLGGGHALRRAVYEQVGGYHESFVWGEEELDMSYRAIEAGFEIYYAPDVVVQHRPGPTVLQSSTRPESEIYYHVKNRFFLARRFLPARVVGPYLASWLLRYAWTALFDGTLTDFLRGVHAAVRSLPATPRRPLSRKALAYLSENHGRVWY